MAPSMVSPSIVCKCNNCEWNHYLIEINYNNNIANIDLNGKRSISFPLYGDKWEELIYNSKFKDWEGFAKLKSDYHYKTRHKSLLQKY